MTNVSHEGITGNIAVGNVSFNVTGANITSLSYKKEPIPNLQNPFIELFSYIYGAVIIFYFGSRTVETYLANKK